MDSIEPTTPSPASSRLGCMNMHSLHYVNDSASVWTLLDLEPTTPQLGCMNMHYVHDSASVWALSRADNSPASSRLGCMNMHSLHYVHDSASVWTLSSRQLPSEFLGCMNMHSLHYAHDERCMQVWRIYTACSLHMVRVHIQLWLI